MDSLTIINNTNMYPRIQSVKIDCRSIKNRRRPFFTANDIKSRDRYVRLHDNNKKTSHRIDSHPTANSSMGLNIAKKKKVALPKHVAQLSPPPPAVAFD